MIAREFACVGARGVGAHFARTDALKCPRFLSV